MRYLKMLGLAAVAAMALTAFLGAGTASATKICETTPTLGSACPAGWSWNVGAIAEFSKTPNTTLQLETTGGGLGTTCAKSSTTGPVTNAGSATETVVGSVTAANLKFEECTAAVKVLTPGELEIHNITGTHNGTVTAKGFVVTVVTFGLHCAYGPGAGTDLGIFTPGAGGTDGTLAINAIFLKIHEHSTTTFSIFCPASARWTASYTQTNHKNANGEPQNTDVYITES